MSKSLCCFPHMQCSESQTMQQKLILREFTALSIIFKTKYCIYIGYPPLPHTWVDFINVSIADLPLCLPPCYYQQSPVQSWLEKEWEECVWSWESFIESSNHPFHGPCNGWWQREWVDMRGDVITGATEAMCPVLRAGKWCCGSGRAGKRCPQLPPAYVALPDHHQPPLGSWRWVRQPGNLPLLRWWPPASVALPEKDKRSCLDSQPSTFSPQRYRDDLCVNNYTFSTTKRALSASCWATCFISTASVNSLPKVKCVCKNTIQLFPS